MPLYIERGGEVAQCPPGVAMGTRAYCFLLEADRTKLAEMYDRYLNVPSEGAVSYEPASSMVILMFAEIAHLAATQLPDLRMGYMVEREVAIWTVGFDRVRQQLSAFNPYMAVDHPWAMAMGREVYGFPKQLGIVTLPFDHREVEFALDLPAVPVWGPSEKFDMLRLLQVTQTTPPASGTERQVSSQPELVAELGQHLAERRAAGAAEIPGDTWGDRAERAAKLAEMLSFEIVPIVLLKQIRDARMPLHACFQSVQLADFEVTAMRGAGILGGEYEVEITDFANEPIRRELGLAASPLHTVGAFWVDFDFQVTVSEELWRADTSTPAVTVARAAP